MKEVIIAGLARSGTSMTTAIVDALGIDMNGSKFGLVGCPKGDYEDGIVTKTSVEIFQNRMSKEEGEHQLKKHFENRRALGKDWGFKATLFHFFPELFLNNLNDPKLVVVFRNSLMNTKSLVENIKRHYGIDSQFMSEFLSVVKQNVALVEILSKNPEVPTIFTTYQEIKKDCVLEGKKIAGFLGIDFTASMEEKIKEIILPDYTTIS